MSSLQAKTEWSRVGIILLLTYCFVRLGLLTTYAFEARFVMDELVQVEQAQFLLNGIYDSFDPIKTVLYSVFYWPAYAFTNNSVQLMRVARVQSLVLALVMIWLTWSICRHLGHRRLYSLLAVAGLLSSTTFLERAFRVRSDTVAAAVGGLAIWFACRGVWNRRRAWITGILAGIAFLCTQKAIYYLLALGASALLAHGWPRIERLWRDHLQLVIVLVAGWCIPVLIYAIVFGGNEAGGVLVSIFASPLQVAITWDKYYSYLGRFRILALTRDAAVYGFATVGLLWSISRWKSSRSPRRIALVATTVLTFLVLVHNAPWPYVFVSILPLLAVWIPDGMQFLVDHAPRRRGLVWVFCSLLLALNVARSFAYLEHTNYTQIQVMRTAEAFLGPADRYADGLAMLPARQRATRSWWDAMTVHRIRAAAKRGDFQVTDAVFAAHPKLWIYNYRVRNLWSLLGPRIVNSYVPVTPNLWLSGATLPPRSTVFFLNHWPGSYTLYDATGKSVRGGSIEIGGEIRAVPTRIEAGEHTISLAFTGEPGKARHAETLFLLPTELRLPDQLPALEPPLMLFGGVYE